MQIHLRDLRFRRMGNAPMDNLDPVARKVRIEHFEVRHHLLPVRFVKTVLIVLLALLWAAASNHCKLEQIPEWDFLACCNHEDTAPHQDDDCATDGCATVENQLYKTETAQISVAAPTLLFATFLCPLWAESSNPQTVSLVLPDAAPAELSRVWQFSYRTALPPRAPSIAS